ncbi:MAG TPA: N-acetylmuramoyl-L-alanine amidase [Candidatus Obscuribacterales bacterium]|nr:N-acetylmuramoyl-L-alanine amidase [Candidatus Obscuribacterales bacterium]
METYYQTEQSRALATAIHQQLVQGLGVPDRSVRKARFYVINHTPVPAILAEVGFISNQTERDNLGSANYQVKIADSVSAGITQYLTEKQELAGKSDRSSF